MRIINIPNEFTEYVVLHECFMGGFRVRLHFPNGYGASIINHQGSYGLELAVLHHDSLCYSTPITDDVIGHMTDKELKDTLIAIMNLESDGE